MKFWKLASAATALILSASANAASIEFHFTGRLTVVTNDGSEIVTDNQSAGVFDPYGLQTPISSTFTYDTDTGYGQAQDFLAPFDFLIPGGTSVYDMSMQRIEGSNLMLGNMLINWAGSDGIPVSMIWDASGLLGAIDLAPGGLQANDVVSGTNLLRNGQLIGDVGSAIPATDGLVHNEYIVNQGPAPLAMTTLDTSPTCFPDRSGNYWEDNCLFVNPSADGILGDDGIAGSALIDGPFPGFNINIDLGSGNSLTVVSVSSVPVPGAVWLFSSGLISLVGFARRQKA